MPKLTEHNDMGESGQNNAAGDPKQRLSVQVVLFPKNPETGEDGANLTYMSCLLSWAEELMFLWPGLTPVSLVCPPLSWLWSPAEFSKYLQWELTKNVNPICLQTSLLCR